jgi:predicted nucleic acid-binding protein
MIVVSDAGPLIALGKLGQLGLLLKLYGQVIIPREVYLEVVVNGLRFGAPDARAVDFLSQQGHIQIVTVSLPAGLPKWASPIDVGEIEVILLAQQQKATWVLVDDAHARKAAYQAGLRPKGTVGVLLAAHREGYLLFHELDLLLQNIKAMPELWISERLCDQALSLARQKAGAP